MNAAELRIGNWVHKLDMRKFGMAGRDVQVTARQIMQINADYRAWKRIPITEDWLLSFGWKWNKETDSYERFPDFDARMFLAKPMQTGEGYTMYNHVLKATIRMRILYVHQLQNLYFTLSGKELELK